MTWQDLIKFIRVLSKTSLADRELEFARRFSQEKVPWSNISLIAEMEGVTGLFYVNLKNSGILDAIPTSIRDSLEKRYNDTRRYTSDILEEANRLSARFKEARIKVVALQGLSLLSVYGDLGLRLLGDIDLMVRPKQKEYLKRLLLEDGYHNSMALYPNIFFKNIFCIDIHTHVLNLERIKSRRQIFPSDLTAMWDMVVPLFDQTGHLFILDPYDNLIALSAHALKHGYSRLIWLADIHESLLKLRNTEGWDKVIIERAQLWRQEKILLYSMLLVEYIFGIRIPFELKKGLGLNSLNIMERHLLLRKIRGSAGREIFNLLWVCNIKGVGNKIDFLKEIVFPGNDILAQIHDNNFPHIKGLAYAKRFGEVFKRVCKNFTRS